MTQTPSVPLIKWVGGKRKLLPELMAHLPNQKAVLSGRARYFEPFIGGAALFMHLQSLAKRQGGQLQATLNDFNPELVNLYRQVRDNPGDLAVELERECYVLGREAFGLVRAWDREAEWERPSNAIRRAARFLYLNRTAFNGVWRVNSKGHFNVPFGKYSFLRLPNRETLEGYAGLLKGVEIAQGDFQAAVASAKAGDVVYFDPPYAPVSATASFTGYTKDGFDAGMQHRLAALLEDLTNRGVSWMLSNSDTPFTREVFGGLSASALHTVQMARPINRNAQGRSKVNEILAVSNPR